MSVKIERDLEVKTDRAWGIDRYIYSQAKGDLVAPFIFLHKQVGNKGVKGKITGVVPHGAEVELLARLKTVPDTFFRVKYQFEKDGKTFARIGWLSCRLLKEMGEKHGQWGQN